MMMMMMDILNTRPNLIIIQLLLFFSFYTVYNLHIYQTTGQSRCNSQTAAMATRDTLRPQQHL